MITGLSAPIEAVDIYVNPFASNYPGAEAAEIRRNALVQYFGLTSSDAQIINVRPSVKIFAERHILAKPIGRLSVSMGGDMSVTGLVEVDQAFNRLVLESGHAARGTSTIAVDGIGNGKNVHNSLGSSSLIKLLGHGVATVSDYHPLHAVFPAGEGLTSTSIAGHGALAAANYALSTHRESWLNTNPTLRLGKEMLVTDIALGKYDTRFTVASDKLEDILPEGELAGIDFLTMTHIAKQGRVPIELLSNEIFVMTTQLPGSRIGRMAKAAFNGIRFSQGHPTGGKITLEPGEEFSLRIETATDTIGSQIDGDQAPSINAGDTVTYRRSAIATRILHKPIK